MHSATIPVKMETTQSCLTVCPHAKHYTMTTLTVMHMCTSSYRELFVFQVCLFVIAVWFISVGRQPVVPSP